MIFIDVSLLHTASFTVNAAGSLEWDDQRSGCANAVKIQAVMMCTGCCPMLMWQKCGSACILPHGEVMVRRCIAADSRKRERVSEALITGR